jgi:phosphate-selective porin OprO/OprP
MTLPSKARGGRLPRLRGARAIACLAAAALLGGAAAAAEPDPPRLVPAAPRIALGGGVMVQPYLRLDADLGGFWDQPRYAGGQPPVYLQDDPPVAVNLRRALLGLRGTAPGHLAFGIVGNLAPGVGKPFDPAASAVLYEAQLAWSGLGPVTLRGGVIHPAHLVDYALSSFELPMLERSAVDTLAASLASGVSRLGAGGEAHGARWFLSAYATGGSPRIREDGSQRGLAGRAVGLVLDAPEARLALGVNGAVQFRPGTGGSPGQVTLRDYPELELSPLRLFDTKAMPAGSASAVGPELSGVLGPLYVQAEYQQIRIDSTETLPDRHFWGYALVAALPLLGAPRRYDPALAVFTRPAFPELDPATGHGGWLELAARWSYASLDDGSVRGGRQGIFGLALNYYPARAVRVSLQYSDGAVKLDGPDRAFRALAGRVAFNW